MWSEVQGHTVQSMRFARTSTPAQKKETKSPAFRRMARSSGILKVNVCRVGNRGLQRVLKRRSRDAISRRVTMCECQVQCPLFFMTEWGNIASGQ
jgi:hypothetical protein